MVKSLLRRGSHIVLYVLLSMTILTAACIKRSVPLKHPHQYPVMESEGIEKEISRLELTSDNNAEYAAEPESYLYLALLYSHHNNPNPNHQVALKMIERYLMFDHPKELKNEAQYLKSLLQQIVETNYANRLLKNNAEMLAQTSSRLKENNEKMEVENQNLKESIEKLKLLDVRLEEKRLNIN